MSGSNEHVMRRFVEEVINKGNYAALDDLVHSDYVYRSPDQELRGSEAIEGLFRSYRTAFPNLNTEIDDLVVADDKCVMSFTLTGTHKGDLMGIPATGKSVKAHGMVLSRFEDGKIIEEWEILDMLTLLQQLDVVSLPA